ncbi:hypothetical protein BDY21DRAFT_102193 [Lineolata rhizophorae]|uniref:Uncharacterized protein n=1 Tax=Lineolata rhizophorae TaxID=578093 RepID=A0A6A6NTB2_9PEZI|nr:hypothetical protein BDY21DRAFT_102193 [Lineolata rhizophorae]
MTSHQSASAFGVRSPIVGLGMPAPLARRRAADDEQDKLPNWVVEVRPESGPGSRGAQGAGWGGGSDEAELERKRRARKLAVRRREREQAERRRAAGAGRWSLSNWWPFRWSTSRTPSAANRKSAMLLPVVLGDPSCGTDVAFTCVGVRFDMPPGERGDNDPVSEPPLRERPFLPTLPDTARSVRARRDAVQATR